VVGLQQWRQGRFEWWQAGWQLAPVEMVVSLSLPPIQLAVGIVFSFFLFFSFWFFDFCYFSIL
jgi:hypothetical protein